MFHLILLIIHLLKFSQGKASGAKPSAFKINDLLAVGRENLGRAPWAFQKLMEHHGSIGCFRMSLTGGKVNPRTGLGRFVAHLRKPQLCWFAFGEKGILLISDDGQQQFIGRQQLEKVQGGFLKSRRLRLKVWKPVRGRIDLKFATSQLRPFIDHLNGLLGLQRHREGFVNPAATVLGSRKSPGSAAPWSWKKKLLLGLGLLLGFPLLLGAAFDSVKTELVCSHCLAHETRTETKLFGSRIHTSLAVQSDPFHYDYVQMSGHACGHPVLAAISPVFGIGNTDWDQCQRARVRLSSSLMDSARRLKDWKSTGGLLAQIDKGFPDVLPQAGGSDLATRLDQEAKLKDCLELVEAPTEVNELIGSGMTGFVTFPSFSKDPAMLEAKLNSKFPIVRLTAARVLKGIRPLEGK